MKKKNLLVMTYMALAMSITTTAATHPGSQFNKILSAAKSVAGNNSTGNILSSVLGTDKAKQADLVGTWKYNQPGVAFTSSNTLAKAGGEVAASSVKTKLKSNYTKMGIQNSNTQFTFNSDKTFSGKLRGQSLSGTYSYDESTSKLTLKTLLMSIPCYVQKSGSGMSLLFESKKLLTLLQSGAKLSGNANLQTLSTLSNNYDGVRMGFDMKK